MFFILFLSIYTLFHLWLLYWLHMAFPTLPGGVIPPLIFLILMIAAPFLTRYLEHSGRITAATVMAYTGYTWMGFIFLFVSTSLLLLLLYPICRVAGGLFPWFWLPGIDRSAFLLSLLISLIITIYGLFEASALKVEYQQIRTGKLSAAVASLRIVQISDLHVGLIVGCREVQQLVEQIRRLKPDLLVATGDIVDGHIRHFDGVAELLKGINPPLGMLAVPGNHEYYAGISGAIRFLEQAGFTVLRGQRLKVSDSLLVVGLDDPVATVYGKQLAQEGGLLEEDAGDRGRFRLLLKHRPTVEAASRGKFDLQLSGHVHKGQIFPFNLLTWLSFPVRAGMNRVEGGGLLYVSRGTGTWGPPVRFLAPPEVTVIDLLPE